jgi:hypothetical protein
MGSHNGGMGSIAAVRLLSSMLFGVAPFDPVSCCTAGALLLLTVSLAGASPGPRRRLGPTRSRASHGVMSGILLLICETQQSGKVNLVAASCPSSTSNKQGESLFETRQHSIHRSGRLVGYFFPYPITSELP